MTNYETPAITELGSVADFTQGPGPDSNFDGGMDYKSHIVWPGGGGGGGGGGGTS
jgi:hypothetical protein